MNKDKICNIVTKFLLGKDIKLITGYSGGANLPMLNSFSKNRKRIRFLKTSNEQCAGHVIEGYTKSINNRKPGVILGTSGPGVTNTITPLQNAYCDGTPLFLISGQVGSNVIGTDAFQECDAVALTKPCTKDNHLLSTDDNIVDVLHYLYDLSMEPRYGPVHLDIPKDVMMAEVEYDEQLLVKNNVISYENYTYYDDLITNISNSKKPIMCLGQGCNSLDQQQLVKMIEYFKIPVTTTLHSMGCVDTDHRLNLGMVGMHGSGAANNAIQEADLIIGLGNRFDDRTIGNIDKYAPSAIKKYIDTDGKRGGIYHIDNSLSQLNKVSKNFSNKKYFKSIYGDTAEFVNTVSNNINNKQCNKQWNNRIDFLKNNFVFNYEPADNNKIKTQDVISKFNEYVENNNTIERDNIIYTTGVGNHQMFTSQYIRWTKSNSMITSGSLGTMGVGVPFAIGSKLANPDKTVICIDGDGSFCMTSSELQTIGEHIEDMRGLKIFIMNDGYQSMVKTWQDLFFDGNFIATDNKNPNFVKLAESYGIRSLKCTSKIALTDIFDIAFEDDRPLLIEFQVEYDKCLPLVCPGKALDEMLLYENDIKNNIIDKSNIPS